MDQMNGCALAAVTRFAHPGHDKDALNPPEEAAWSRVQSSWSTVGMTSEGAVRALTSVAPEEFRIKTNS